MERIVFIWGDAVLYGSSLLLALGAATAVCVFLALYLKDRGSGMAAAVSVPAAFVLSLLLARFLHWYCRESQYPDLLSAMTELSSGEFALMGVFGGCALAAGITRVIGLHRNLPRMLDCMSIAGCAGMAVGRLSACFNSADRGMVLGQPVGLPWGSLVVNPVSDAQEYRLATFALQAVAAAVLFAVLLVWLLAGKKRNGDVCLVFLLCHGASQVLLDSTRYDSLYFRSNGFVSIVQVLGAAAMGLAAVVFSVRLVRQRSWKHWYPALWGMLAALMGLAGYMEYHVQRHPGEAATAYSVMGICLAGSIGLCLGIRALAEKRRDGYDLDNW